MINSRTLYSLCFIAALASGSAIAKTDNPLAGMGGKHDAKTPIEVTSDALEVHQDQNQAIFTGHVVAIQGDVRLKADKMTVFYKSQSAPETTKAKTKEAAAADEANAIQKIEAVGNVFLSTQEETASGSKGVYDVEHHEIHLNDNVILTRGKNVLKGDALVYNFDTGKSRLVAGGIEQGGAAKGGRVRALFVPENNDKGKK